MTKLCRCGHKKTDHKEKGVQPVVPCHAKTDHREWDECMCIEFSEVERIKRKVQNAL